MSEPRSESTKRLKVFAQNNESRTSRAGSWSEEPCVLGSNVRRIKSCWILSLLHDPQQSRSPFWTWNKLVPLCRCCCCSIRKLDQRSCERQQSGLSALKWNGHIYFGPIYTSFSSRFLEPARSTESDAPRSSNVRKEGGWWCVNNIFKSWCVFSTKIRADHTYSSFAARVLLLFLYAPSLASSSLPPSLPYHGQTAMFRAYFPSHSQGRKLI